MLEFATLQLKYEEHVRQFSKFRKNIVDKLFGTSFDKIDIKLPDSKQSIEEITAINRRIETINEIVKEDLPRMVRILEKVNIHHGSTSNIVYTIQHGSCMWAPTNNILNVTATVNGIY